MAENARKSKLVKALVSCRNKERGIEGVVPQCDQCPFHKEGSLCKESMMTSILLYMNGKNDTYPVEIGYDYYCNEVPICPQCERFLKVGFKFCPTCGIALDWDDYADEDVEEQCYKDLGDTYDDYSETSFA